MKNFSKVLLSSSLVLGAVLFSIGCGGDGSCCDSGAAVNVKPTSIIATLSKNAQQEFGANLASLSLDGKPSHDDGTIAGYAWKVGTCKQTFADMSSPVSTTQKYDMPLTTEFQKVCLQVTDNHGNKDVTCSCVKKKTPPVVAEPCGLPAPQMTIKADGVNNAPDLANGSTLSKRTLYALSCDGSRDNCNDTLPDDESLTCEWKAHSFRNTTGQNCNVAYQNNSEQPHITDCFGTQTNPPHDGSNNKIQTTANMGDNTYIRTCGSNNLCVVIEMTVTDTVNNKTAPTMTRIYSLQ